MPAETLLLVHTPRQRFVVAQADVQAIRAVRRSEEHAPNMIYADLGALFDPTNVSDQKRQHGLVVPLRRKQLTFLADRIDILDGRPRQHPLPVLLISRLHAPWSLGAFEIENDLVIQIDVRAVARSLLSTSFYGQAHP